MTTFENILRVINFITTPASIGFGIIFVVILGSEILNEFLGLLIGFLTAIAILIINLAVPILINRKSKIVSKDLTYKENRKFEKRFAIYDLVEFLNIATDPIYDGAEYKFNEVAVGIEGGSAKTKYNILIISLVQGIYVRSGCRQPGLLVPFVDYPHGVLWPDKSEQVTFA